jgi:hypothetical protein
MKTSTRWAAALLLLLVLFPPVGRGVEIMTTNFHTPISEGAAADDTTFNAPLSQLDTGLSAEHESDGSHSDDIIDQAQMALSAAAAANGEAARYQELTAEHNANGTHKTGVIDQAEVNLTSQSAASGDAVRHDEFTQEHNADGTHKSTGTYVLAQSQVDLADAAAAAGDALRYEEFIEEHSPDGYHSLYGVLWSDAQIGGGNGVEPAALTEHAYDDPGSNDNEVKVRVAYVQGQWTGANRVVLVCEAQVTADPSPSSADIQVYITDGGVDVASAVVDITDYGSYSKYSVTVDVSGLSSGMHYIEVRLVWASSSPSGETAKLRWPVIYLAHG